VRRAPDVGAPGGHRFPRARRIRASREIRELFRRGDRRGTADFDFFIRLSPLSHSRIGLVVPKHRHTVVERNRLKRRMREVVRTTVLPSLDTRRSAADVLIRAKPGAYSLPFAEIRRQLEHMAETICSRH
jgi:ribonuclease P protein component